ncbi:MULTISPECIES: CaiB/BaiF CoA transferase family protein [Halomonas]|uniref:CaiB/BaiF CoA transferase family protein n=1 Tax=Halomonas TaxID=2745 RepID=UPI001C93E24D|nr:MULTISPECIES: CaiB/BaiF CoA-transferase family protein [Halomonas]MBY5925163.1 CoA transferase [Halomonas sp. DP4Y7-2]MBY6206395.1 CoA transferase [Halomonas sp. DP3Y7-2]MBY6227714.1 CoA transferase [Halomonas sp. DP3Y7-1]MBY6232204.1 CoA transferase [Halomonas sp. DP4Y7-1]MCA0915781.1 CoA transferase [Halomonas denitrificans]
MTASADTPLPLSGIRVIEFSHMVMGPTCGMILADLGAEVIKIEPPSGDKTRKMSGVGVGFFRTYNRNKKSVVLDIKSEAGQQALHALLAEADVMIENFRPGLMESLGFGYAELSSRYPALIYVSHKGFLPGPYDKRLALDEVVQMMGGLAYMTGPQGRPLRAGASVNDIMGGMFGAIGVLAALMERGKTLRGQEIQSALFENCVFLSASHMQQAAMSQQVPPPMPSRVSPWTVYDVFTLAEGEQLFIGAVSDKQWAQLCEVLGRKDLRDDPSLATNEQRLPLRRALLDTLGETLAGLEIDDVSRRLDEAGLPYAPITRPDELLNDPHLKASGGLTPLLSEKGEPTQTVLLPLLMGGRRPQVRMPLASIGEHTDEILGRAGITPTN